MKKYLFSIFVLLLAVTGAWAQHALYGTQTNSQAAYAWDSENHYVTEDLACANTLDGPTHPVTFTTTSKAVEGETITVYFTDALEWGTANVYYWPNGGDWPGVTMSKAQIDDDGQQVYSATIPEEVDGIIFNGNGNQTVDIKDDIADGAWWCTIDEKDGDNYYVIRIQSAQPPVSEPEPIRYTLTITTPENGTLETSVTNGVAAGTTVTVTATPAEGYALDEITVNGFALAEGVTTFEMPDHDVTVAATFMAIPTYNITLSDGTEDAEHWTISPNPATEGQTVTIKYNGTKRVKGVKVVKKPVAEGHALSASAVGEIVGSDGKAYAVADKDYLPDGVTAVAMVAYVGNASGLAIALADEGEMDWSTAKNTCEGKTEVTDAAWVLPNQNQWNAIFNANGGYIGLNTALATAGGDGSKLKDGDNYWSSTENGSNAWCVTLNIGDAVWRTVNKISDDFVRACFAFTYARTLAEATTDDLGKIAGADGKIYDTKADAEVVATGNAVAMIAYVDGTSGLAIALADEGKMNWSTAKNTCEGKTEVTGAEWLLPSQNQWNAMFNTYSGYFGLNTALATAGVGRLNKYTIYWSSTEGIGDAAWNVGLLEGDTLWGIVSKDNNRLVRACLAFTCGGEEAAAARTLAEATTDDLGKIVGADGKIYDTKADAEAVAEGNAVAMIACVDGTSGLAIALDESGYMDWSTAKNTCEGKTEVTGAAWVLPSQAQWKTMFKANGGNEASYADLNTALVTAGGDGIKLQRNGWYWSSTGINEEEAWDWLPEEGGNARWSVDGKEAAAFVRACLAFTCGESAAAARTLAEATTDDIGKIVGADGKIYATKADAEAVATGNAVAMIAYVGSETGHDTYNHGLAIALADEAGGQKSFNSAAGDCSGRNTGESAVTGAEWLLPSQDQWKTMFKAIGGNDGMYVGLNTALATAGGDSSKLNDSGYWSSTTSEFGVNYGMYVDLYEEGASWDFYAKYYPDWLVRACLAF